MKRLVEEWERKWEPENENPAAKMGGKSEEGKTSEFSECEDAVSRSPNDAKAFAQLGHPNNNANNNDQRRKPLPNPVLPKFDQTCMDGDWWAEIEDGQHTDMPFLLLEVRNGCFYWDCGQYRLDIKLNNANQIQVWWVSFDITEHVTVLLVDPSTDQNFRLPGATVEWKWANLDNKPNAPHHFCWIRSGGMGASTNYQDPHSPSVSPSRNYQDPQSPIFPSSQRTQPATTNSNSWTPPPPAPAPPPAPPKPDETPSYEITLRQKAHATAALGPPVQVQLTSLGVSISELKSLVSQEMGIDLFDVRLYYGSYRLDDDNYQTLNTYNVRNGAELVVWDAKQELHRHGDATGMWQDDPNNNNDDEVEHNDDGDDVDPSSFDGGDDWNGGGDGYDGYDGADGYDGGFDGGDVDMGGDFDFG